MGQSNEIEPIMKGNIQICTLAERPHHLATLASWYVNEWGHLDGVNSIHEEIEKLSGFLNQDFLPLIYLAVIEDELIGAAQLKHYEMDIYPDKKHWLGGVYVADKYRGLGVAKQIIEVALEKARALKIPSLYLQTERLDGGLYGTMGWIALEQVTYKGDLVLVMKRHV